jgi:hypothetical protein
MYESKLPNFADSDWTCIPFELHPPNLFDQIVTILFDVQSCLAIANIMIQANDDADRPRLESHLRTLAGNTKSKLVYWEQQLMPPSSIEDASNDFANPLPSCSSSVSPPAQPHTLHGPNTPIQFVNMPEAALLSLYHAAYIIVLRLLALAGEHQVVDHDPITRHTQEILRAYKFVRKVTGKGPTSTLGPVMMVPQLKIASLWGAEECHREMATSLLKRIGQRQSYALGSIWDSPDAYFANVASYALG